MSKIYTPYHISYLIIIFLFATLSCCIAEEINSTPEHPAHVIDGDSLEINNHQIRLMGIDAPEYDQRCKNNKKEKYHCGKESTKYLKNIIKNNQVTCHIHKKDQYNRELCTCYANNINLNAEMVKSGHAVIYMESPYQKEEKEAKQNKRGLWRGRFMQPRLFRRLKEAKKSN